jgi:hypothetical protein
MLSIRIIRMKNALKVTGIFLFLALSLGSFGTLHAQPGSNEDICLKFELLKGSRGSESHFQALSKTSLESYRFRSSDRVLEFEDGTRFKLFSATQLQKCNADLNLLPYAQKRGVDKSVTLIFKLLPNESILVRSVINPISKLARIGKGFPKENLVVIRQAEFNMMPESKQEIILSRPHQYLVE